MANEGEDLVSQVRVTGTEESAAKLQAYADQGAASFAKLDAAAKGASAGVESSAAKIDAAGKTGAGGFQQLANGANSTRDIPGKIKDIENAISNLTSKFPQLTQAVGRFTQRLALVGAAGAAAAVGLAKAASNVAKAYDGENDSAKKATASQIDANNSQLSAETAAINHASSLRQLQAQLAKGQISYAQYGQAVNQLNADYREQQIVAAEVENAQRRVKEENDRLTKSLANREALGKLIDTFGGPLTTSLVSFGRQVDQIHKQFIDAFGPSAAGVIDLISNVLSKNAGAIGKFFTEAAKKIDALLKTNGPQIQTLLENLGAAAASVFNGLISAAPGVIDFINNQLTPAVKGAVAVFQLLADAINFVFGGKQTAGSLILIAILAQMTGAIRLLFALLRTGGAIFKGFIALLESVGLLIAEAFGASKAAQVIKFGSAVAKGGGPIKSFLAIVRTAIPLLTLLAETVAVALGISFGSAAILVAALTAALIYLITKVDWKKFAADASAGIQQVIAFFGRLIDGAKNIGAYIVASFQNFPANMSAIFSAIWAFIAAGWQTMVANTIAEFDAIVAYFASFPTNLMAIFTALWGLILAGWNLLVQGVITAWNGVVAFFTTLGTTLAAPFVALWGILTAGWQVLADGIKAAWQTVVDYFQPSIDAITGVFTTLWNALQNGWNTAFETIKRYAASFVATVKSYLQPLIDLINTIGSALSSVAGGGGGGSSRYAEGGKVNGRGTSTSDSIPAWLSNGEFVVKAASVQKYGTDFLHRLNSGRLGFSRFAEGGLASIRSAPSISPDIAHPRVSSMLTPLNLTLFGETFEGLMMPEDTATRMTRFAIQKQSKSGGRKPSWVGQGRS